MPETVSRIVKIINDFFLAAFLINFIFALAPLTVFSEILKLNNSSISHFKQNNLLAALSEEKFEPRVFAPAVISTRDYERDGTFTPDGNTFFFTKRTIWSYFSAICVSYFKNGRWTEPEVASFSGQYADAMPFVSPDGNRLYFSSRRPVDDTATAVTKRDYDIWFVERKSSGWSAPQHLPAPVNTQNGSELSPVITRSGTLYFVSSNSPNIMRAVKKDNDWSAPEPVGLPNEAGSLDLSAYVDPDEKYMIVSVIGREDAFHSAEGIYPRADLYLRKRENGVWSSPLQHLPAPINSAADEMTPSVTPDGRYLIFTSERGVFTEHGKRQWRFDEIERGLQNVGNGLGDIFFADTRSLGEDFAGYFQSVNNSSPPFNSRLLISESKKQIDYRNILPASKVEKVRSASSVPRLFGDGVISTADDEFGAAQTTDGKTIYYTKSAPRSYRYTIVESHFLGNGKWTKPSVAPFSGQYTDSDPVLSPDGSRLFWSSDRPVNGKIKHDYDIWMVARKPNGKWSNPVHLPQPINSDASEFFASVTRDGTLYFSSARDGGETGAIQAYRSRFLNGSWTAPENVTKMIFGNDEKPYYDLDVMIDPDEKFIVISSLGRPEGFGNFDLYIAWKRGDGWSKAVHLPAPFNTPARDYSPHFSLDGKTFYFASERSFALDPIDKAFSYDELISKMRSTLNGSGNIYKVDSAVLNSFRDQ